MPRHSTQTEPDPLPFLVGHVDRVGKPIFMSRARMLHVALGFFFFGAVKLLVRPKRTGYFYKTFLYSTTKHLDIHVIPSLRHVDYSRSMRDKVATRTKAVD